MNDVFPSRETVTRIRSRYSTGSRIELVSMSDPYTTLKSGDRGTVRAVDDIGTVFVNWDSGSSLGVAYGADEIRLLPSESEDHI